MAAVILSRSITQHASAMQRIAGNHVFEAASAIQIDAASWQGIVEQVATDVLRRPVRVASFASLTMEQDTCLRFVLQDGQLLELKTQTSPNAWGNAFIRVQSPRVCGELHAVCGYFAQQSACVGAVPRDAHWQMRLIEPARLPARSKRALPHRQL
jgi:hypothetical protein